MYCGTRRVEKVKYVLFSLCVQDWKSYHGAGLYDGTKNSSMGHSSSEVLLARNVDRHDAMILQYLGFCSKFGAILQKSQHHHVVPKPVKAAFPLPNEPHGVMCDASR